MTTLTFLRHAETEYNITGKFAGRINCNITEKGKQEAMQLSNSLKPFDIYYCSPLIRTFQTLHAIFPDAKPIIDSRIIEISCGVWEDAEKASIDPTLRRAFLDGTYVPDGAEDLEHATNRAIDFLDFIFSTYVNHENILAVAHNGFLRSIRYLFHIKTEQTHVKNLSYFTITYEDYIKMKKSI